MIKPPDPSVSMVGAVLPGTPVERVRGDVGRLLVALQQQAAPGSGFVVGETVSARLVEPLQNRQWLVVVKNTAMALQWPAAGAAVPTQGGTLSLRVASLTPQLSFALIDAAAETATPGAVTVHLSAAAQTLSTLVQAGAPSAALTRVTDQAVPRADAPVLLGDPAAPPAERSQAVAQAVVHSGLFYESHLLAWAEGRMPAAALAREPQARVAQTLQDATPAARDAAHAELGGVLQRQLDALDGRSLAFAGWAWPGQPAQWQLQREPAEDRADDNESAGGGDADAPAWTTQIQLDLPHLGALGAQLRLSGTQLTLAVTLDNEDSAGLLATHRGRLAAALQAVGLDLAALTVRQADPIDPVDGTTRQD